MLAKEQPSGKKIAVFISYSHDSPEHSTRVLKLSNRLIQLGIDCELDQYLNAAPAKGWPIWMEDRLDEADYILVVCTETYYERVRRKEKRGIGRGVKWESLLTYQEIYDDDSQNKKFIPIIFTKDDARFIPRPLRPTTTHDLSQSATFEALLRTLTNQPKAIKPTIGEVPVLPPNNDAIGPEEEIYSRNLSPPPNLWLSSRNIIPILLILCGLGWLLSKWYYPSGSPTLTAKSFLEQGEYEVASRLCLNAPYSRFRTDCLKLTNLALIKINGDADELIVPAKEMDSSYSKMLLGDYYLYADFSRQRDTLNFDGQWATLTGRLKHNVRALCQRHIPD